VVDVLVSIFTTQVYQSQGVHTAAGPEKFANISPAKCFNRNPAKLFSKAGCMVVRIRFQRGRPLQRTPGKNRHVADAIGALLTPAALMAYVLGFWRLASDMGVAGEFGINGLFSHWQVWMLTGVLLQGVSRGLLRYGRGGDLPAPRTLMFRLFPVRHRVQKISTRSTH
jgi:hypothetical protein